MRTGPRSFLRSQVWDCLIEVFLVAVVRVLDLVLVAGVDLAVFLVLEVRVGLAVFLIAEVRVAEVRADLLVAAEVRADPL